MATLVVVGLSAAGSSDTASFAGLATLGEPPSSPSPGTLGLSLSGDGDGDDPAPLGPATSSKPGGGSKSILDDDAAYAIASGPYGIPKRTMFSRLAMSRSCSGVGPPLGYVSSVFTSVCVSGAEIECRLISDGDVRPSVPLMFPFDRVRESRLNIEFEPECDGWCRIMRLRRWSGAGTDMMDGPEPSRVCPLLLRGSGEAAGGRGGGELVAVADGPRECRGLKIDANTERRRVEPDCSVDVRSWAAGVASAAGG